MNFNSLIKCIGYVKNYVNKKPGNKWTIVLKQGQTQVQIYYLGKGGQIVICSDIE